MLKCFKKRQPWLSAQARLGSSVAFHLAKAGVAPVALVDKHEIASQTSPRAAGLTSQVRQSELMTRLATMAVDKIRNFTAETGEEMIYFQSGSLRIARTSEHEQQLRRDVERGQRLGVDIDFVSPARGTTIDAVLRAGRRSRRDSMSAAIFTWSRGSYPGAMRTRRRNSAACFFQTPP